MKLTLAIVGDRKYDDYEFFSKVVDDELERFPADTIVSGDATGVDTMARRYATKHGIPFVAYCASERTFDRLIREGFDARLVANWNIDGYAAGPIRNRYVLIHPAHRVLLFNGGGSGSKNVLEQARRRGIEVEEHRLYFLGTPRAEGGLFIPATI